MTEGSDVNTGLAGSLVMIVLTLAFVFLVVSFYRRYKRASETDNEKE